MTHNDTVSEIEKLIETCRDGEKGYRDAAEHIKRPDLKTLFSQKSSERARFANELEAALGASGNPEPKKSGSVTGALHRAWIDTKANLGGGDKTILESVESGEDKAKEAYQKALATPLPADIAELVGRQAASVQNAHDQIKALRDGLAA